MNSPMSLAFLTGISTGLNYSTCFFTVLSCINVDRGLYVAGTLNSINGFSRFFVDFGVLFSKMMGASNILVLL